MSETVKEYENEMVCLKKKLEENREEVLRELDTSEEFLSLLTQCGLLNSKDRVKYQGIKEKEARNLELISTFTEQQTDDVYLLFLQCLRQTGQSRMLDLISDKYDRIKAISTSQTNFLEEIQEMCNFLKKEESRVGIDATASCSDEETTVVPSAAENSVLSSTVDCSEQAVMLFSRSRQVIRKLHSQCTSLAEQNAEITLQVKNCDSDVRHILHTHKIAPSVHCTPRTVYDMFSILMDDVNILIRHGSKMISKVNEERAQSMSLLRMCRDCVGERSSILKDFHISTSTMRHSKSRVLKGDCEVKNMKNMTAYGDMRSEHVSFQTVLDGLVLLEVQLKEYIYNEIMLTNKYKMELKLKKLKRQCQGFSSIGFANSSRLITCIQNGENVKENALKLKVILDKISEEYEECIHYLSKTLQSEDMIEYMDVSSTDLLTDRDDEKEQKKSPIGTFVSMFKKQPKTSPRMNVHSLPDSKRTLQLPLVSEDQSCHKEDRKHNSPRPTKLVDKLKILVSNYQDIKSHSASMTQKFRQDWERKKREINKKLRVKEEEIVRLQLSLSEMTAEKQKYQKLYEQAKLGFGKYY